MLRIKGLKEKGGQKKKRQITYTGIELAVTNSQAKVYIQSSIKSVNIFAELLLIKPVIASTAHIPSSLLAIPLS